jgi:hypothetical protein
MDDERTPIISLRALEKALESALPLRDLYFPLHDLDEQAFDATLPVLLFVEATTYQIDEDQELHIEDPTFVSPHFERLRRVLAGRGLLDAGIDRELERGRGYYVMEQRLCSGSPFSDRDVRETSSAKTFDFPLMHRVALQLTGRAADESLFALLRSGELYADLFDDLQDYAEDRARNTYNSYRMLVRLYGADARPRMERWLDALEDDIARGLQSAPPELGRKLDRMWTAFRSAWTRPLVPEPVPETSA